MRTGIFFSTLFVLAIPPTVRAAEPLTFEHDVRPILKAYCLDCHGASEKMSGGLDLRLQRFALTGGKSGPAFVLKSPEKSLLIERMKLGEMPPGEKKVPAQQIAIIEKWITSGAKTVREEPATIPPGLGITDEERAYWLYQPLKKVNPPQFAPADRIRTPIDAYVLARLRDKGFAFNPDADRATLIRRASFDLTGLPPTQKAIEDFVADQSENAYEKLLDQLMASPAYGERWARHWLDAAGYSDSDGNGASDTIRPYAWRYRDYVIRSLNADKPLNQFVVEQLAGDELVPRPWTNLKPDQIELLAATGFLRTAPDATSGGGNAADAEQVVTDTLKIVTTTLLGSSVACAQCHDHRYDPIPQLDYFRLRAIFEPALDPARWRRPTERVVSLYTDADRAKAAAVDAEAAKMQASYTEKQTAEVAAAFDKELEKFPMQERPKLRDAFKTADAKRTDAQKKLVAQNPKLNVTAGVLYQYNPKVADELKAMQEKINAKRAERPVEQFVAVLAEVPGRIPDTRLYHRGDARQPVGPALTAADLTIAAPEGKRYEIPAGKTKDTSGRRLAWAQVLTSGTHPLFGRTLVNRIWLNHFGRGIVDTPGEFGKLGQLPTHPELLDWLALELPHQGWSLKKFHKLIMSSTVYRQTSTRDSAKDSQDRANALYGRFPVRRLEAEAVRDRMLVVTGRLDSTLYGPAIPVVEDSAGQVGTPDDKPRRSIYLQSRRSKPVAFLNAFDAPAGELQCERRSVSTTAPQSLMLMNSDFVRKQAAHFATRVNAETKMNKTLDAKVTSAWKLAYLRAPSPEELQLGTTFLRNQATMLREKKVADPDTAALTNFCQQLLSSNEFLYVD